jgi:hypothetical protein
MKQKMTPIKMFFIKAVLWADDFWDNYGYWFVIGGVAELGLFAAFCGSQHRPHEISPLKVWLIFNAMLLGLVTTVWIFFNLKEFIEDKWSDLTCWAKTEKQLHELNKD